MSNNSTVLNTCLHTLHITDPEIFTTHNLIGSHSFHLEWNQRVRSVRILCFFGYKCKQRKNRGLLTLLKTAMFEFGKDRQRGYLEWWVVWEILNMRVNGNLRAPLALNILAAPCSIPMLTTTHYYLSYTVASSSWEQHRMPKKFDTVDWEHRKEHFRPKHKSCGYLKICALFLLFA